MKILAANRPLSQMQVVFKKNNKNNKQEETLKPDRQDDSLVCLTLSGQG